MMIIRKGKCYEMIKENHYLSLRKHIRHLISGLVNNKKELPQAVLTDISEEFYMEALEKLEKQRKKLVKKEQEYFEALGQFRNDYERTRRMFKKDMMKLKRSLKCKEEKLVLFGISRQR